MSEHLGQAQRERQAWAVLSPFEVSDRLVVHPNRVGQLLAGQALRDTKDLNAVEEGIFFGTAHECSIDAT